jgi:hypothetical protein
LFKQEMSEEGYVLLPTANSFASRSWWGWGASYLQAVTESVQAVSETVGQVVNEGVDLVSESVEMVTGRVFCSYIQSTSVVTEIYDAYKGDLQELGSLIVEDTSELINQVVPTEASTGATTLLTEGIPFFL